MKRLISALVLFGMVCSAGVAVVRADDEGTPPPQQEGQPAGGGRLQKACGDDIQQFCKDVAPGGGRIIQCLKQNKDSLSQDCQTMLKKMGRRRKKNQDQGGNSGADQGNQPQGGGADQGGQPQGDGNGGGQGQ